MPVHIPAAPGFYGWTKLARERTWKTMKAEEVIEMQAALDADWAECGHGRSSMPNHNTGHTQYVEGEPHSAYTYQCRSGSRWFNPETRKMEGHAHCTCDGCF